MSSIFAILVIIFFFLTILGLISPKYYGQLNRLVNKNYKDKGRGKLFISNFILLIVCLTIFSHFSPPNDSLYKTQQSSNEFSLNNQQTVSSKYQKINTYAMIYDYGDNEARGDVAYKGKHVEFTGTVSKISSGSFYGATVYVDSDSYGMGGLGVAFTSLDDASKLNRGQQYTFRGKVTGRIMGTIMISGGEVVN